jgi:hypothetical protein
MTSAGQVALVVVGCRPLPDQPCTLSMTVFERRIATLAAGNAGTTLPVGRQEASDEAGGTVGRSAAEDEVIRAAPWIQPRGALRPFQILASQFLKEQSPNYQVQRPATGRSARGRAEVD